MTTPIRFEGIVRPFQTRDLSPPKIEPTVTDPTAVTTPKTVKFEWGKGRGSGDQQSVGQWNSSINVQLYMTKRQREQRTNLDIFQTPDIFGPPPPENINPDRFG